MPPVTEMVDLRSSFEARLKQRFEATFSKAGGDEDEMGKMRAKGWQRYLDLGLPERSLRARGGGVGYEVHRLRALYELPCTPKLPATFTKEAIAPHLLPESTGAHIVFANGLFAPHLSDLSALGPLIASSLSEALLTYGTFLRGRWSRALKEESDPFAALNAALHDEGLFLYLPPKKALDRPIQILHAIDASEGSPLISPRLHLFMGTDSSLNLLSTLHVKGSNPFWMNSLVDITVDERATLKIATHSDPLSHGWLLDTVRASLKRIATFELVSMDGGAPALRHDYSVSLMGEGAKAHLSGARLLGGSLHSHTEVRIEHIAPGCSSRQHFKAALTGRSKSSFRGMIDVASAAQQTDAFQLCKTLFLSDEASCEVRPELRVRADEVKASHGATTGELDPELLFALTARGINPAFAQNLLIGAFVGEIIPKIPSLQCRASALVGSLIEGIDA